MPLVELSQLQPGDVLLCAGRSWVARAIQLLDRSEVDQAGFCLGGGQVAVAGPEGLRGRSAFELVSACTSAQAFRHINGQQADPVVALAHKMIADGHWFASHPVVDLSLVLATRRAPQHATLGPLATAALGSATALLRGWTSTQLRRRPLAAGDLIFRSYDDALPAEFDRFTIEVDGINTPPLEEGEPGRRRPEPGSLLEKTPAAAPDAPAATADVPGADIEELAEKYVRAVDPDAPAAEWAEPDAALSAAVHAFARGLRAALATEGEKLEPIPFVRANSRFVTAGDLLRSQSFDPLGAVG